MEIRFQKPLHYPHAGNPPAREVDGGRFGDNVRYDRQKKGVVNQEGRFSPAFTMKSGSVLRRKGG